MSVGRRMIKIIISDIYNGDKKHSMCITITIAATKHVYLKINLQVNGMAKIDTFDSTQKYPSFF